MLKGTGYADTSTVSEARALRNATKRSCLRADGYYSIDRKRLIARATIATTIATRLAPVIMLEVIAPYQSR
jgi:hypothetical protein